MPDTLSVQIHRQHHDGKQQKLSWHNSKRLVLACALQCASAMCIGMCILRATRLNWTPCMATADRTALQPAPQQSPSMQGTLGGRAHPSGAAPAARRAPPGPAAAAAPARTAAPAPWPPRPRACRTPPRAPPHAPPRRRRHARRLAPARSRARGPAGILVPAWAARRGRPRAPPRVAGRHPARLQQRGATAWRAHSPGQNPAPNQVTETQRRALTSSAHQGRCTVCCCAAGCRLLSVAPGDRARLTWKPLQRSSHPRTQRADGTPMLRPPRTEQL
jgi:hypothetical protein